MPEAVCRRDLYFTALFNELAQSSSASDPVEASSAVNSILNRIATDEEFRRCSCNREVLAFLSYFLRECIVLEPDDLDSKSAVEQLATVFKLVRNMSASRENQLSLISEGIPKRVLRIVSFLIRHRALYQRQVETKTILFGLQALCNSFTSNIEAIEVMWPEIVDSNILPKLLSTCKDTQILKTVLILILNATMEFHPWKLKNRPAVDRLVETLLSILSSQFGPNTQDQEEELFHYVYAIIKSWLEQGCAHRLLRIQASNELLRILDEIVKQRKIQLDDSALLLINSELESCLYCLSQSLDADAGEMIVLSSSLMSVGLENDHNQEIRQILTENTNIIPAVIAQLSQLHKQYPPLKLSSTQDVPDMQTVKALKSHPAFGVKTSLVQVLASLTFKYPPATQQIMQQNAAPLILEMTNHDAMNPMIKEVTILLIRNMSEGSKEFRDVIAGLDAQEVTEESKRLLDERGMSVSVERESKRVKITANNATEEGDELEDITSESSRIKWTTGWE